MADHKQPSTLACVTEWRYPVHLDTGQQATFQAPDVIERIHIQAKTDSEGWVVLEWNGSNSKIRVYSSSWLTLEILGRYDYDQQFVVSNDSALNVVVEVVRFKVSP